MATRNAPDEPTDPHGFVGKVLIVALVVILIAVGWRILPVFLLAFGAILLAVALRGMAAPIAKWTKLSSAIALTLTVAGLLGATITFFALFGAMAAEQFIELARQLPGALDDVRAWLGSSEWGRSLLPTVERATSQIAPAFSDALSFAGGVVGGIGNIVLMLVAAVYFAADPQTYLTGTLRLLPPEKRSRARVVLTTTGKTLHRWLYGMMLDMLFLGLMTGIGLWIVGVPLSFALGVLSGASVFVPYIGPIVATAPGLLLALSVEPRLALYALVVYIIAQEIEGYVSLPLLQRWAVAIPPVLSLLALVSFGLLFGLMGILLSAPLAVALMTIVRMVYIEDGLERSST